MNKRYNNNRRARGTRRNRQQPLQARDLDAVRVRGTELPPDVPTNLTINRRIRVNFPVGASSSTFNITPNLIALQDATDYATGTNLRFEAMRVSRVEAWFTLGTITGYSNPVELQLGDQGSGAFFKDAVNPGVDYAHVAVRLSLARRMNWFQATDTSDHIVVIEVTGLGSTTGSGTLYVDFTVDAC